MVASYVPILPSKQKEDDEKRSALETFFVSDSQATSNIARIFIGVAIMIFAGLLTGLLIWAYKKDLTLFIVALCVLFFLYGLTNVTIIAIIRSQLGDNMFTFWIGSGVFMTVFALLMVVIFGIKYGRLEKPSSRPVDMYE